MIVGDDACSNVITVAWQLLNTLLLLWYVITLILRYRCLPTTRDALRIIIGIVTDEIVNYYYWRAVMEVLLLVLMPFSVCSAFTQWYRIVMIHWWCVIIVLYLWLVYLCGNCYCEWWCYYWYCWCGKWWCACSDDDIDIGIDDVMIYSIAMQWRIDDDTLCLMAPPYLLMIPTN